eukprot:CAMPEP_0194258066 /NCGR_PEP_ID=MMETSP0158-20130606/40521_1 /TAXON_ID=33649 /ORGANISM="Thalassionema nitzschioides, Strain L26-B" /LENGTH=190 /DNA_ID=CAMNT_0038997341 /DNA_START=46 /DNA_END=614 /DNA_ORIENTATION=+
MIAKTKCFSNFDRDSVLKPSNLKNGQYISPNRESWRVLLIPDLLKEEITRSVEFVSPEPKERSIRKAVGFGNIQIRYYSQTVGDHPCTARGPPISLDWQYNDGVSIPVDDYESKIATTSRKKPLILSDSRRRRILMQRYGYDLEDINTAIIARRKVARQREKSAKLTTSMKLGRAFKNVRLGTKMILQVR